MYGAPVEGERDVEASYALALRAENGRLEQQRLPARRGREGENVRAVGAGEDDGAVGRRRKARGDLGVIAARRLGQAGRTRFERQFTAARMAEETMAVYDSVRHGQQRAAMPA